MRSIFSSDFFGDSVWKSLELFNQSLYTNSDIRVTRVKNEKGEEEDKYQVIIVAPGVSDISSIKVKIYDNLIKVIYKSDFYEGNEKGYCIDKLQLKSNVDIVEGTLKYEYGLIKFQLEQIQKEKEKVYQLK